LHFPEAAQFGYNATDTLESVVLSALSWSVRLFGHLTGDYLIGAFIVSAFASIAAAVSSAKTGHLDHPPASRDAAKRGSF